MEASLLDFVLDVAQLLLADITQHFAQHPFQGVVLHGSTLGTVWRRDRCITVVADVERGAEAMAALLGSVSIALCQSGHIVFRPQDARYDDFVQRDAFYVEAVELVATYRRKQMSGSRN